MDVITVGMVKKQILIRATKNRKLHRAMIAHILKGTKDIQKAMISDMTIHISAINGTM